MKATLSKNINQERGKTSFVSWEDTLFLVMTLGLKSLHFPKIVD